MQWAPKIFGPRAAAPAAPPQGRPCPAVSFVLLEFRASGSTINRLSCGRTTGTMMPSPRPLLLAAAILCFCLGSSLLQAVANAKEVYYEWDIEYQKKAPDCFEKLAVTVNGEAPGPTIHATQGDTVVVTVHNKLWTENTAIHWHGIRQIGTPWADGVSGVTQCPIPPGETFTYRFVVDRVRK